jgi:hypothetical protein
MSTGPRRCCWRRKMNDGSSELTQMQQVLALAHGDLACYAAALWPQFSLAPHHNLIVSRLEAVERGEISRLMIFMPPRHGKSLITSTMFPAWYLGRHPDRHVIFATYGQELSDDFGRRVRNLLRNELHQAIFSASRFSRRNVFCCRSRWSDYRPWSKSAHPRRLVERFV